MGSESLTPPELIGKNLSQLTQIRSHDRFRLAVIIHYLLFGYHPFMGKWTGSGNPPGQNEAISQGYWPYGKNSLLTSSPNTIPLNILNPKLEKCFLKCFNDGHQSATSRPSPEDWINALQVAINDLVVCSRNKNHVYSKRLSRCCWCDRSKTLGVDIFPKVKKPIAPQKISVTPPPKPKPKKPDPAISRLQSEHKKLNKQLAQANQQVQDLSIPTYVAMRESPLDLGLNKASCVSPEVSTKASCVSPEVSTLEYKKSGLNQQLAQATKKLSYYQEQSSSLKKVAKVSTIIAIATTIAATAIGGLSFFQYKERNQVIKQIEQIRQQNNLSPGQWDLSSSYSLESEWENLVNIIEDKEPLISGDLDELIEAMETETETSINELQQKISNLEATNRQLEEEKKSLQSRNAELEDKNESRQNRINSLNNTNTSLRNRIDQLENKNKEQQNRINELEYQNNYGQW